jgi:MoxR-like ATPase
MCGHAEANAPLEIHMVGAILISGIPGSAKTTIARRVAAEFQRSAHLEGDLISFQFIVSGFVPPQGTAAR